MSFKQEQEYYLGLDLGNRNIKCVGEIDGEYIRYIIKSSVEFYSINNNLTVQLDGETDCIGFGVGEPLVVQDKTKRPYLEHSILLAIYKIYGSRIKKVKIGLGIPLILYCMPSIKTAYAQYLKAIRRLTGTVCGEPMDVEVDIELLAEGYSAFYVLSPQIEEDSIILLDHGYRSTDVVSAHREGDEWIIDAKKTYNIGLYEIYTAMGAAFLNDSNEQYSPETIDELILKDRTFRINGIDYNLNDYAQHGEKVIKGIYNLINIDFPDVHTRSPYLVSGAHKFLEPLIPLNQLKVIEEDNIYLNAEGYFLQVLDM